MLTCGDGEDSLVLQRSQAYLGVSKLENGTSTNGICPDKFAVLSTFKEKVLWQERKI